MKILVDIGHPGHVHFYKHAIRNWHEEGHQVLVTARDKDVTLALLRNYHIDHCGTSCVRQGHVGLAIEFVEHEWRLWRLIKRFDPNVVTAIGGIFIAPVCKMTGVPSVVFTDSEHVSLDRYLTYPLASVVCTPSWFKKEIGPRQLRYHGFQELAYLQPKYFTPDPEALNTLDLDLEDRFAVLRFVAWHASHDRGHTGFTDTQKKRLIRELEHKGQVLVSVEGDLPDEFKRFQVSVAPEKIHDLLYYASLYVGEGATMATEAGLLGTPSVYVSSLVGTMGNYEALARYGLAEAYQESDIGVKRAIALMQDREAKREVQEARDKMLREMSDVTGFLTHVVKSYGEAKR
jgi:uncharacterized protein